MIPDVIAAFRTIRDIPYRIPLDLSEENNCCSGKAVRLRKILEAHGYVVRYRVCSFSWKESFELPESLINTPHEDASTHVYLEVKIDGVWKNVDPTWDPLLANITRIADWDGKNDTPIAVRSTGNFDDETSRKIMEEPSDAETKKDLEQNGRFYAAFNDWLEENRKTLKQVQGDRNFTKA